jgi:hypothetical protein
LYALFELLHAVRDNLNIDLRESAPAPFRELPASLVLGYYPSPYPAAENEYRIPSFKGGGAPDLRTAALARAAEFAIVAFDPNAQETQFLQGWLIHDRFLMRGPFGILYEFLWANPYLPGLSYYHLPMALHDETTGRLFLRSSWEEDATWVGFFDGQLQLFEKGELRVARDPASAKPVQIGDALVVFAKNPVRFQVTRPDVKIVFVAGLKPGASYEVEIDDEEMDERAADRGGIIALTLSPRPGIGIRLQPVAPPPGH